MEDNCDSIYNFFLGLWGRGSLLPDREKQVDLIRVSGTNTYGVLIYKSEPLCITLELPDLQNQTNISCIPIGSYKCIRGESPSKNKQLKGKVFKVLDVPDRTNILIHIGNYHKDTQGCILVGMGIGDKMITNSVAAMTKLLQELPDEFILNVC